MSLSLESKEAIFVNPHLQATLTIQNMGEKVHEGVRSVTFQGKKISYPHKVADDPNSSEGFLNGKTALERHVEFFAKKGKVTFGSMIKGIAKIKDPITAFYEAIIRRIGMDNIADKKCPFSVSTQRVAVEGKHPVNSGIYASNSNINKAALEQLKEFDKDGKGGLYLTEIRDLVKRNIRDEKEFNQNAEKKDRHSKTLLSWLEYNNRVWEWEALFQVGKDHHNLENGYDWISFTQIHKFFYEPEQFYIDRHEAVELNKPNATCDGKKL